MLYKRRWIAGTAFTIVFLLVTVYTFTATPIYEATTKLLIESDNPNVVSFKEVMDEQGSKNDYYTTQYNILQSRTLARRTLNDLKLWNHEQFGGSPKENKFSVGGAIERGRRIGPRRVWFGQPAGRRPPTGDETAVESRAIDSFLANTQGVAGAQQPHRRREVRIDRIRRCRRRWSTRSLAPTSIRTWK